MRIAKIGPDLGLVHGTRQSPVENLYVKVNTAAKRTTHEHKI